VRLISGAMIIKKKQNYTKLDTIIFSDDTTISEGQVSMVTVTDVCDEECFNNVEIKLMYHKWLLKVVQLHCHLSTIIT